MKRYRLLLLLMIAALLPLANAASGPSVRASLVWIRQAPPGVAVLAGYFTLQNLTDTPLTLTAVESRDFGSVEIHRSFVKDGVEEMEPVPSIAIPAHGSIEFKPGSYHLMMMQPKKNLFAGDMAEVTLTFSDGSQLAILAPVRHDPPAH
ncbi:MAG TPA: copper chaperone PCu(A)C [Gammaproteobacteria bacterium]|nr:copper chaperone PCu(A)C [Gammaproteobacteria bacterium]